jgi:hypothetical protein
MLSQLPLKLPKINPATRRLIYKFGPSVPLAREAQSQIYMASRFGGGGGFNPVACLSNKTLSPFWVREPAPALNFNDGWYVFSLQSIRVNNNQILLATTSTEFERGAWATEHSVAYIYDSAMNQQKAFRVASTTEMMTDICSVDNGDVFFATNVSDSSSYGTAKIICLKADNTTVSHTFDGNYYIKAIKQQYEGATNGLRIYALGFDLSDWTNETVYPWESKTYSAGDVVSHDPTPIPKIGARQWKAQRSTNAEPSYTNPADWHQSPSGLQTIFCLSFDGTNFTEEWQWTDWTNINWVLGLSGNGEIYVPHNTPDMNGTCFLLGTIGENGTSTGIARLTTIQNGITLGQKNITIGAGYFSGTYTGYGLDRQHGFGMTPWCDGAVRCEGGKYFMYLRENDERQPSSMHKIDLLDSALASTTLSAATFTTSEGFPLPVNCFPLPEDRTNHCFWDKMIMFRPNTEARLISIDAPSTVIASINNSEVFPAAQLRSGYSSGGETYFVMPQVDRHVHAGY